MLITILLIIACVGVSLVSFQNETYFQRYAFSIEGILHKRQWERLFSSIFLHVDYVHLFFNIFSFYSFAIHLEPRIGSGFLLAFFLGSALGGNLLALIIHHHHRRYRAAGASGAISGIIFSAVLLLPGGKIMIFPFPVGIPDWLFAVLFVVISLYGIGRQSGNIGHEAHLGGALTGVILTALVFPRVVIRQWILTLVLIIPVVIFLFYFLKDPGKFYLKSWRKFWN
ncbi:MAG: rhomboid family intramembrane serine protease [Calditrichia bacterium]